MESSLAADREDQATAHHEAGHAVIAMALGRPVQKVSIQPDSKRLGWCAFKKGAFRPTDDWLEREILISLAGLAAEAKFTGEYGWAGATHDLRIVQKLATQRAGEAQSEKLQRRMLAKVENLLSGEGNWLAVELMAAELLRKREISGRAARHFFDTAHSKIDS